MKFKSAPSPVRTRWLPVLACGYVDNRKPGQTEEDNPHCGAPSSMRACWARRVKYSWFHRLMLLIYGYPQPGFYEVEYTDDPY